VIPAAIWGAALLLRPSLIDPICGAEPDRCNVSSLMAWERFVVGMRFGWADWLSFRLQDLGVLLGILVPVWLWLGAKTQTLTQTLFQGVLFLQTSLVNGAVTELFRVTVQRPRPFVYESPLDMGLNPAHYTSFVSGHSSFTACAATFTYFQLSGRLKTRGGRLALGLACALLPVSTGVFRVLAGRHFPTDIIGGIAVGFAAGLAVHLAHKRWPLT
jgi:membrane-associated phospholipid phosphatase